MKSIVVAMDRLNGIGAAGELPWGRDLPADLRHFKEITTGGTVIMGRKTYDSIGRPLPNRENIVITRSPFTAEGILCVTSLERALRAATRPDVHVIGGGQIYEQAIAVVDALHVTYVDADFPACDAFFPQIPCDEWSEVSRDHHGPDERNKYGYDFVTYERSLVE